MRQGRGVVGVEVDKVEEEEVVGDEEGEEEGV